MIFYQNWLNRRTRDEGSRLEMHQCFPDWVWGEYLSEKIWNCVACIWGNWMYSRVPIRFIIKLLILFWMSNDYHQPQPICKTNQLLKQFWISEAICHQWERWYNDFHQSKTVLISHTEQMQPSIPVSSKLCWRNCQKKLFSSEPKRKSAFSQTTKKFFFLENFLLAQWTMII